MVLSFSAAYVFVYLGAAAVGGLLGASYFWVLDHFWYHLLRCLDKKGIINRFAPHMQITAVKYQTESFWTAAVSGMLPSAIAFAGRERWFYTADFVGACRFTWTAVVLQDVYFWLIHTMLHKVKYFYGNVHQLHHTTTSGITAYSSTYGTVLDYVVSFTPFLSWMMYKLCLAPKWNLFHLAYYTFAVTNIQILGHSGYDLPVWIHAPGSLGVSLTPGVQGPLHHYIHHLDPRFNRSLYFTWCDRIAGTFAGRMKWEEWKENYSKREISMNKNT